MKSPASPRSPAWAWRVDHLQRLYRFHRPGLCTRRRAKETARVEDDRTAFIVPDSLSADGRGSSVRPWDMHASSAPYVVLLHGRPTGAPAFLAFSLTGCIGMIGMNDAGIAIGINNLLGAEGQVGVTWPFVVRRCCSRPISKTLWPASPRARLVGGSQLPAVRPPRQWHQHRGDARPLRRQPLRCAGVGTQQSLPDDGNGHALPSARRRFTGLQ